MNKQTFNALRSEFREISRKAYKLGGGIDTVVKNTIEGKMAFCERNPTEFSFEWFDKPCKRQQVISMKIYAYLDYPFESLKEVKFN